ncbi:MAG: hypothetical protein JXQ96_04110 [Cyclobacteriaceae bacterium]
MKKIIVILIILVAFVYIFKDEHGGPNTSQNGISTNQLTENIMLKYDKDSSGTLDVAAESFLTSDIEGLIKVESRGLLFTDADEFGNNDGTVSKDELEKYLGQFDTDGDGEITSYKNIIHSIFSGENEWSVFASKYQEKYKYTEK